MMSIINSIISTAEQEFLSSISGLGKVFFHQKFLNHGAWNCAQLMTIAPPLITWDLKHSSGEMWMYCYATCTS